MAMFFTTEGALALLGGYIAAGWLPRLLAVPAAAVAVIVLAGMAVESGPFWPAFWPLALVGTVAAVWLALAPRKVGAR